MSPAFPVEPKEFARTRANTDGPDKCASQALVKACASSSEARRQLPCFQSPRVLLYAVQARGQMRTMPCDAKLLAWLGVVRRAACVRLLRIPRFLNLIRRSSRRHRLPKDLFRASKRLTLRTRKCLAIENTPRRALLQITCGNCLPSGVRKAFRS